MSNRPRHYKRKVPADRVRSHNLSEMLTIKEAAALWFRHPTTIQKHIDAGNIAARQSGSIWLISKQSMIDYYGHSPLIKITKNS